MSRLHRFDKAVMTMAVLAAVVPLGALAHGGDPTKIHACLKEDKFIRIVGANDGCRGGEQPLDWNIQGPAGPPGPMGPAGPAGPAGVSGIEIVQSLGELDVQAGDYVLCPEGKIVIGGGFNLSLGSRPQAFYAVNIDGREGWYVQAAGEPVRAAGYVYAVCANAAP